MKAIRERPLAYIPRRPDSACNQFFSIKIPITCCIYTMQPVVTILQLIKYTATGPLGCDTPSSRIITDR